MKDVENKKFFHIFLFALLKLKVSEIKKWPYTAQRAVVRSVSSY